MQDRAWVRWTILALFFLSGAAGLIYQIAWTRMLVLVFGNTLLATSTVLSAFMAGLAAGSYVLGIHVDRRPRRLLRLYALLELGIGLYALAFPLLIAAATPFYAAAYGNFGGSLTFVNLLRFAACFALIAIPTFLMGGTLPVLVKRFAGELRRLGVDVGSLYGLNTAGAVLGTIAAGYWLLGAVGLRATTAIAVALNLGVALVSWLLPEKVAADAPSAPPVDAKVVEPVSRPVARAVHIAVAASGFCALAYEVLWARMLNLFLNHNIYSFTATIATFLTGIAIGSLLYARRLVRFRAPVALFAATQLGIAGFALLTPYLFVALQGALFSRRDDAFTALKTAIVMLPPTVLMGVAVPLAMQICQRGRGREGRSVGSVYAANTVGSILGAFAAGFALVPIFGLHAALIAVAALNLGAGLTVLAARRTAAPWWRFAVAGMAIVLVTFASAPRALFRDIYQRATPDSRILHYKEGTVANVVVYDFDAGYKDLHLNGVEEASSRLWHVQLFKLLGVLPMVAHEDPGDALMIAFGAGMSAGATARLASSLEVVDLNPDIGGPAALFRRENLDVLAQPNLTITVNDGRNELLLDSKRYSVIISDATNPKMFDSWTLYTREFYELTRERLLPGGVFAQWLVYPLPGDSLRAVLNTFRSVFPHASLWCIHGSSQCLMLGTPDRLEIDYPRFARRLDPILRETGFVDFGVATAPKFLSFLLLGEDELGRYLDGYDRISTDDLPYPQFQVGSAEVGVRECLDLLLHQRTAEPYLVGLGAERRRVVAELEAHRDVSQRLNLGFYLGDRTHFQRAALIAAERGLAGDANVASALHSDDERLRHHLDRYREQPADPQVQNRLGHVRQVRQDLARARRHFERAIELDSDFVYARANLARVLLENGDYGAATAELVAFGGQFPTSEMLQLRQRGLELARLLRRAQWEPPTFELSRALARARLAVGDLRSTAAEARRAVTLAGDDPQRHLELAALYEALGLLRARAAQLRRAASLAPGDPRLSAWADEAERIALREDVRRQWLHARAVSSLTPPADQDHPSTCRLAMRAWSARAEPGSEPRRQLELAASLFERSIRSRPDHLHAYFDAALLHELGGDLATAASILRSGVAQFPQLEPEFRRLELEAIARHDDADVSDLLELADLRADRGDFEIAVPLYRRAIARAPEAPVARSRLTELLVALGNHPGSAAELAAGAWEGAAPALAGAPAKEPVDSTARGGTRMLPAARGRGAPHLSGRGAESGREVPCGRPSGPSVPLGSKGGVVIPRTTLAVLVAGLALAPAAWGFHDGGVATCGGCHVTHNSIDGQQIVPGAGNEFSLKAGSATDVCLSCHAQSLGAVLSVSPLAPSPEKGAGNFVFLLENNLNDAPGGAGAPIGGEAAGHSVVAPAHGLAADSRYPVAPGGTFAASELGCTSCHDPHGRGSFRMLYGAGPVQAGAAHFGAAAPVADGLALSPSVSEQRGAHSAYRSGMSDWCGNCHGRYHESAGSSAFSHPIDAPLSATVRTQYDLYDGVTNSAGGNPSTSYLPEVPFEDGTAAVGSTAGPTVSSRLSCLSCHRAHASSAPAAGRWDFNVSTLGADGVESGSWPIPNPYVDPTQPALCWKCHPGGTGP